MGRGEMLEHFLEVDASAKALLVRWRLLLHHSASTGLLLSIPLKYGALRCRKTQVNLNPWDSFRLYTVIAIDIGSLTH